MTRFQYRYLWVPHIIITLFCAQMVIWAFDRKSPFEVVSSVSEPVMPGDHVSLIVYVRRDTSRGCRVDITRWLESGGYRTYLIPLSFEAEDLAVLQKELPGKLLLNIIVPKWFPEGTALYRGSLVYECNPLHKIWPIVYQQSIPFVVSPK